MGGPNVQSSKGLPTPPDGGWGWVVVFASFMIHVIADGVTYTFGIFFVELSRYYNTGKGETSWIASILVGVTLGSGPLASVLTNRYGCRIATIAGAVLATIGFILSLFSPNVLTLYVTIGVCSGLGFGLMYLPAIVCVTCYFEKKRAFATGIAVCGSGFGTFIFAPLIDALVNEYGWKGGMLIMSGVVLNCAVFGAMFRPLRATVRRVQQRSGSVSRHTQANKDMQNTLPLLPREDKANMKKVTDDDNNQYDYVTSAEHDADQEGAALGPIMYRKDVFYSGSVQNLQQYRSNPSLYTVSVTRIPRPEEDDEDEGSGCCSKGSKDAFYEMMDLRLLALPVFLLFSVSNFCTSIGFNVPYVYIKDRGEILGFSSDSSSFLISIIGIANTVSRVVLGYISDKPQINRLWLYNSALVVCGTSTALSVACVTYGTQAFYAVVFGATAGAYVGLTSVILVDLVGMDKLTNAFGILLLFQGVASLIGPPIAGWLYDALLTYDAGFYTAGSMIAVSGAMLFAIPTVQKCSGKVPDSIECNSQTKERSNV